MLKNISEITKQEQLELSVFEIPFSYKMFAILTPYYYIDDIKYRLLDHDTTQNDLNVIMELCYPYCAIGETIDEALNDLELNLNKISDIYGENYSLDYGYDELHEHLRYIINDEIKNKNENMFFISDFLIQSQESEYFEKLKENMINSGAFEYVTDVIEKDGKDVEIYGHDLTFLKHLEYLRTLNIFNKKTR